MVRFQDNFLRMFLIDFLYIGWSDASPLERTSGTHADDLHKLLQVRISTLFILKRTNVASAGGRNGK